MIAYTSGHWALLALAITVVVWLVVFAVSCLRSKPDEELWADPPKSNWYRDEEVGP